jgi:hypothetical protein
VDGGSRPETKIAVCTFAQTASETRVAQPARWGEFLGFAEEEVEFEGEADEEGGRSPIY